MEGNLCCGDSALTRLRQRATKIYLIFTSPTTSPPLGSTAWTHTLLNPSFNSGYWAIIALARLRASAWVALKSAVLGTEYFIVRSKFLSLRKKFISVMLYVLPPAVKATGLPPTGMSFGWTLLVSSVILLSIFVFMYVAGCSRS